MVPAAVNVTNSSMNCVVSPTTAVVRAKTTDKVAKACDLSRIEIYTCSATSSNKRIIDTVLLESTGDVEKKCNRRVM